jgi:type II secretory pathway component PulC
MNNDVNVIWKKGDEIMPAKARRVVDVAHSELILKTLGLPDEITDVIRYNADKSAQSINDYISTIVIESLKSAS